MPSYSRDTVPALVTDATIMLNVLSDGTNPFGITAAQIAKLHPSGLSDAANACANEKSATTDAQLATLDLPPRRGASPRPQIATPVAGLMATPAIDGSVRLA